MNLVDVKSDDGIQAPSIRYKDGTFYIITTCVYRPPDSDEGTCTNFIITAKDVAGPWSEPHVIADAPGQDSATSRRAQNTRSIVYIPVHSQYNKCKQQYIGASMGRLHLKNP